MIHHSWLGKSKHCFITRDLANPNISSLATRLRLVACDEIFGFASSLVMKQCFDLPRHSWYIIYPNFHFHKWYIWKKNSEKVDVSLWEKQYDFLKLHFFFPTFDSTFHELTALPSELEFARATTELTASTI